MPADSKWESLLSFPLPHLSFPLPHPVLPASPTCHSRKFLAGIQSLFLSAPRGGGFAGGAGFSGSFRQAQTVLSPLTPAHGFPINNVGNDSVRNIGNDKKGQAGMTALEMSGMTRGNK